MARSHFPNKFEVAASEAVIIPKLILHFLMYTFMSFMPQSFCWDILKNYWELAFENPSYKWTREAQIKACIDWGKPVGLPGQQMKYSDTGYVILGGIIEKLNGKNLNKSVSE